MSLSEVQQLSEFLSQCILGILENINSGPTVLTQFLGVGKFVFEFAHVKKGGGAEHKMKLDWSSVSYPYPRSIHPYPQSWHTHVSALSLTFARCSLGSLDAWGSADLKCGHLFFMCQQQVSVMIVLCGFSCQIRLIHVDFVSDYKHSSPLHCLV